MRGQRGGEVVVIQLVQPGVLVGLVPHAGHGLAVAAEGAGQDVVEGLFMSLHPVAQPCGLFVAEV